MAIDIKKLRRDAKQISKVSGINTCETELAG